MAVDAAGQTAACFPNPQYEPSLWEAESHGQCDLLRDLIGPLPFRPARFNPLLPKWNEGLVVKLAQAAYDDRLPEGALDEDPLGVLADALEEAGVDNEEILTHLRQPGQVHYRGCWCVDLLLCKE